MAPALPQAHSLLHWAPAPAELELTLLTTVRQLHQ